MYLYQRRKKRIFALILKQGHITTSNLVKEEKITRWMAYKLLEKMRAQGWVLKKKVYVPYNVAIYSPTNKLRENFDTYPGTE